MPGFLDILSEAAALVQQTYPNAEFLDANGTPSSGTATSEPDVDEWAFRFAIPEQEKAPRTVTVDYQVGKFGNPVYDPNPFVGEDPIVLPIGMGLQKAIDLKCGAGDTAPFPSVSLVWPVAPGNTEPYYVFPGSAKDHYIFVGTQSSTVREVTGGFAVQGGGGGVTPLNS